MSQKTKIVVLHMKEVVYTAIFAILAIILLILLLVMFRSGKDDPSTSASTDIYEPGTYSSPIVLGGQNVNVDVVVDSSHITSISFSSLDDSIATMYPLMESSLEELSSQIIEKQSTEGITYQQENQYTSQILLNAIHTALDKAHVTEQDEK